MALDRILLANFRNHRETALDGSAHFNLLVGENGAGKTNVLEAISLLAPGRGLRRAQLPQMAAGLADRAALRSAACWRRLPGHVRLGTAASADRPNRRGRAHRGQRSARHPARRMAVDRLADPGDGPAVRRGRGRPPAVPRPAGAGVRAGPCAQCRPARGGAARAQPAAVRRARTRNAMARRNRGADRRGRRAGGRGAGARWSRGLAVRWRPCPRRHSPAPPSPMPPAARPERRSSPPRCAKAAAATAPPSAR